MAEVVDVFEMTPVQGGMLFHTLMAPDSGTYFEQCWCVLGGPLDEQAFKAAWRRVIGRHEVLRSECHWVDLDRPVQVIYDDAEPEWHIADWSHRDAAEQDRAFSELLEADRSRGFHLDRAPLLRFALIRLGEDRHRFLWSFHHLLMDGWCGSLLVGEMLKAYAGHDLPPPPPPYRRYVDWRAGQDTDAAKTYWSRALADAPDDVSFGLERATGEHADAVFEIRETVDAETATRLAAMARRERLTLATVLQGAWALLLARYSGREDIVLGTVLAGRPPGLPGSETMVGLFLNTVPLRVGTTPERTLIDWLRDLQTEHRQREQHGHAALSDIQRWAGAGGNQSLFETLLIVENLPLSMQDAFAKEKGALSLRDAGSYERTNYPIALRIFPGAETVLALTVSQGRLSSSDARRVLRHYRGLLSAFADRPDARLGDIDILLPEERSRLLQMGRGPTAPSAPPIHEQVFARAAEMPEKAALVYTDSAGETTLSYHALAQRVDALAMRLHARGISRGMTVAVCLDRGPDLLPALLAVMRAGATYLPVDPDYPAERIAYMLEDAGTTLVLADGSCGERVRFPDGIQVMNLEEPDITAPGHAVDQAPVVHSDDLAYILYTSGSTGLPKGVAIQHGALSNFIQAMTKQPGIGADDRLLALTTIGFDIAGLELFGPLVKGGTVILTDGAVSRDGARLVDLVGRVSPTLMQATPAGWRMLVEAGWKGDPQLRLLCGGEALDSRLATQLLGRGRALWNLYGPTETTIWSAAVKVEPDMLTEAGVPVAGPIDRTELYVLDPRGEPTPIGVAGELHIAGAGLSPGYRGKPGLTADRFVPNPFATSPDDGLHLYRTGDLARWREDGMLDFLGRLDNQIKLRGYRIEPGEVEARLCAHPMVAEAVVLVEDRDAGPQLVAYLRWRDAVSGNPAILLRDHVAETLPSYMIPTVYVPLDRFPLTPNGKVDRKRLKGLRPPQAPDGGEVPPIFGEPASTLAALWREVLKAEHIGLKDNFFELGGHSLLVITLQNAIRERLDLTLDITDFFRFPTLETLADRITALTGAAGGVAEEQHGRAAPRRAGRERLAQRRSLRA